MTTRTGGENEVDGAVAQSHLYSAYYIVLTFQLSSFKNLIKTPQKSIVKCLSNVHPFWMNLHTGLKESRVRVEKPTISRKPDGDEAGSDCTLEAKHRELRDSETFSGRAEMFTNMNVLALCIIGYISSTSLELIQMHFLIAE